jgi:nudix-type nucleoside diphosphatase (YffH/AdpP family)
MARQVKILREDILSKNWYTLKKITFEYQEKNGTKHTLTREAYDRGNGATILLYNKARRTVILTRQFRMPTFINGNPDGMLIEACAGLLDLDQPAEAIRRETREETGFQIDHVEKIFEAYRPPSRFLTEKIDTGWKSRMRIGKVPEAEDPVKRARLPFD